MVQRVLTHLEHHFKAHTLAPATLLHHPKAHKLRNKLKMKGPYMQLFTSPLRPRLSFITVTPRQKPKDTVRNRLEMSWEEKDI